MPLCWNAIQKEWQASLEEMYILSSVLGTLETIDWLDLILPVYLYVNVVQTFSLCIDKAAIFTPTFVFFSTYSEVLHGALVLLFLLKHQRKIIFTNCFFKFQVKQK